VDGSVELMVHRRLLYDDDFGVGEALNETAYGVGLVVRGKHWLLIDSIKESAKKHRDFAQRAFLEPLVTFSNYESESDYYSNYVTTYSGLMNALPPNVHLLTLEQWKDNRYLLRLEHFYQLDDDPEGLSKPVTVDIRNLFKPFQITEATEMTLGANLELASATRLDFKSRNPSEDKFKTGQNDAQSLIITLNAMQIRTFLIRVTP